MERSDLPFGSEFSPSQIALRHLLELAAEHGGDWRAFEHAVRVKYFDLHKTSRSNRAKLANNCKLGMIAYGLVDRGAKLTPVGRELYKVRDDERALLSAFAKHILLRLHGLNLIQCVRDMQAAGEAIDLRRLRERLADRGLHVPRGGKHPSIMRLWLEKAGVFTDGWRVDEERLSGLVGKTPEELEVLATLSPEQRAFLKALANLGGSKGYASSDVEKLATATYGTKFNEKSLPKQVLYPLEKAGYISLKRGTKEPGRGAKPFIVSPTPKFAAEIVLPLIEQFEAQTRADIRPFLRRNLEDIVKEVDSADRHVRGLALEALAVKLLRLIDLTYVATRLRGDTTGGVEVDVIFEGARLVFSRWQVQCKNTRRVSLDDVAKEVGLAQFLKTNVIVIVTTGRIAPDALEYAELTRGKLPINVCYLGGDDLREICESPAKLVTLLSLQAPFALCHIEAFSYLAEKSDYGRSVAVAMGPRV